MKITSLSVAAFVAATFLPAQDQKKAPEQAPPNPKTAAHAALAQFVGTWQTHSAMAAMPGVPGMEQASEWDGTDHGELICNGLWLKMTSEGTNHRSSSAGNTS